MCTTGEVDEYVGRWWCWFAIALVLLLPLDLLTTMIAVSKYGIGVEANPVMRELLQGGLIAVTVVHLVVVGLVVTMFHVTIDQFRSAAPPIHGLLVHGMNIWIAVLVLVGLVVVANNLVVIVSGSSLLISLYI